MRVLISADIEGVTGVVAPSHTSHTHPEHTRFRRLMTEDVNAAIEGALAGGADSVVVNDSHGRHTNILIESIHPAAELITGAPKPLDMMQGIGPGVDMVFLIGYHARAGTAGAILAHTTSGAILTVRVNGVEIGETGLSAAVAGAFGVPVTLVTGDRAVTEEAHALLGSIETVAVKEGISQVAARCLPPAAAQARIREAALRAVSLRPGPYLVTTPVTLAVTFQLPAHADFAQRTVGARRADGRTVEWVGPDMIAVQTAYASMWGLARLADLLRT